MMVVGGPDRTSTPSTSYGIPNAVEFNGEQSVASASRSLSSSGSTQSSIESPSEFGNPSSAAPLQLLSRPSPHTSSVGAPGVQVCAWPPTQFCTVTWQAPTPHVVLPRLSSGVLLQLLSSSSHTSAAGVPGVQVCD